MRLSSARVMIFRFNSCRAMVNAVWPAQDVPSQSLSDQVVGFSPYPSLETDHDDVAIQHQETTVVRTARSDSSTGISEHAQVRTIPAECKNVSWRLDESRGGQKYFTPIGCNAEQGRGRLLGCVVLYHRKLTSSQDEKRDINLANSGSMVQHNLPCSNSSSVKSTLFFTNPTNQTNNHEVHLHHPRPPRPESLHHHHSSQRSTTMHRRRRPSRRLFILCRMRLGNRRALR